ncbi:HAD family hydrolase [soil metagenome]
MSERWFFFDLDGTLWDHHAASTRAIMKVCERYSLSPMAFIPIFRTCNDLLWREIGASHMSFATLRTRRFEMALAQQACGCSSNDAQEMGAFYMDRYLEAPSFYPEAREMICDAAQIGRVAILTNGPRDNQSVKLSYLNDYAILIDFMLCGEDINIYKPVAGFFDHALKLAGLEEVESPDIFMLGDTWEEDVAEPLRRRWEAGWISHGRELPEAGTAAHVFREPKAFREWLKRGLPGIGA